MASDEDGRPPHQYTLEEWTQLTRVRNHYMMPVVFDDLLAPNLPVDAMRILRHLWWRRWGGVQSNGVMPPERIAAFLPEWAPLAVTTAEAYRRFPVAYEEVLRSQANKPATARGATPEYSLKKLAWSDVWQAVDAWTDSSGYQIAADAYQRRQRQSVICRQLLTAHIKRKELAAIFGPSSIDVPTKRGRGPASLRTTLLWMEKHRLITVGPARRGEASTYEFGDEMWHVLTQGDFSRGFREMLDTDARKSAPFFRPAKRGLTPSEDVFGGVRLSLGAHYRAPAAMEVLLEANLPVSVMAVVWFVARNTLLRDPRKHSSLGYVILTTKRAATLFGPARVQAPSRRGRRVRTVREAIDWAVEHGILDRKVWWPTTELSLGPEVWFAFRHGRLSPELRELLGAESTRVRPAGLLSRENQLTLIKRLSDDPQVPLRDVVRMLAQGRRRARR